MIAIKHIEELAQGALSNNELFIVDISVDTGNSINVVLDSDCTVAIEDCITVSRAIEHQLDRDIEDFSLKVTSAGLGQPFRMLRQFSKYLGKDLEITVDNGVRLKGELKNVNSEFVELLERQNKIVKHKTIEGDHIVHKLAMKNIKEAKAIVTI